MSAFMVTVLSGYERRKTSALSFGLFPLCLSKSTFHGFTWNQTWNDWGWRM